MAEPVQLAAVICGSIVTAVAIICVSILIDGEAGRRDSYKRWLARQQEGEQG